MGENEVARDTGRKNIEILNNIKELFNRYKEDCISIKALEEKLLIHNDNTSEYNQVKVSITHKRLFINEIDTVLSSLTPVEQEIIKLKYIK